MGRWGARILPQEHLLPALWGPRVTAQRELCLGEGSMLTLGGPLSLGATGNLCSWVDTQGTFPEPS